MRKLTRNRCAYQLLLAAIATLLLFQTNLALGEPSEEDMTEAGRHFDQGVDLHNGGDYRGAKIEFRQAYRLAPNFRLLYNLGQESVELKEYVEAHEYLGRYLKDGGDRIDIERRTSVLREIARVKKFLASIAINVTEIGAEIAIDGVVVGVSPLPEPIQVSIGRRKIVVSLDGHAVWERTMDVAGEDRKVVEVKLLSLMALTSTSSDSTDTNFWVGFSVTSAFIIGTSVSALLTNNAKSDHEREISTIDNRSPEDKLAAIDKSAKKYERMALYTDIGIGLSITSAIVTVLLIGSDEKKPDTSARLRMFVAPTGMGFAGQF